MIDADGAGFVLRMFAEGYDARHIRILLVMGGVDNQDAIALIESTLESTARTKRRKSAVREIVAGIICLGAGGGVTGITYAMAVPGETYFVTFGLFIIGVVSLLKGLVGMVK